MGSNKRWRQRLNAIIWAFIVMVIIAVALAAIFYSLNHAPGARHF